jgi:hypothetical protein
VSCCPIGRALLLAWFAVSGVMAMTVAAAIFVPAPLVQRLAPVCEAKARGSECVLCGMTKAFLHLGRGEVAEAKRANRGSLALWTVFLGNGVAAAIAAGRQVSRCKR